MPELMTTDKLNIVTGTPIEKIKSNVLDAAKHCLKPIDSLLGTAPRDGTVALVGGGPSLAQTISQLQNYNTIIIAGSAHDYVVDNYEFTKDQDVYCLVCDPDPIMCDYLQYLHEDISYLIASQCDVSMFRHTAHMPKKYLWNCSSGDDFDTKAFKEGEKLIVGGCTVGTRAIGMAMSMGFKKMHLFGYDSCLTNQYKHHAYDFIDPDTESLGDIREIFLGEDKGKKFIVAGYMLAQIFDFQYILYNYANNLDITVHGGGPLAHLLELAKQKLESMQNGNVN